MQMRAEVKPALWGAVGGAVVLAIIGFGWGGWMTASSARDMVKKNSDGAVVAALADICVTQFHVQTDASMKLEELKKLPSYDQGTYVDKGGWAKMPGSEAAVSGVAANCASRLVEAKV